MNTNFIVTEVSLKKRKTPNMLSLLERNKRFDVSEKLILQIKLLGNGDTKSISTQDILSDVMNKLETICDQDKK